MLDHSTLSRCRDRLLAAEAAEAILGKAISALSKSLNSSRGLEGAGRDAKAGEGGLHVSAELLRLQPGQDGPPYPKTKSKLRLNGTVDPFHCAGRLTAVDGFSTA